MATYRGAKARMMRRFGDVMFRAPKYHRIVEKRPNAPGQHGPKTRRGKKSEYGKRLEEKQKLRFRYNVLEKQMRRYVKRAFNPNLDLQGIVLTMFDCRNNLSQLVADDVRSHLGHVVYDTVIPRNVRVSEAPSHGKPVLLYDMRCPGSQAYIHLAGEILRREAARDEGLVAS